MRGVATGAGGCPSRPRGSFRSALRRARRCAPLCRPEVGVPSRPRRRARPVLPVGAQAVPAGSGGEGEGGAWICPPPTSESSLEELQAWTDVRVLEWESRGRVRRRDVRAAVPTGGRRSKPSPPSCPASSPGGGPSRPRAPSRSALVDAARGAARRCAGLKTGGPLPGRALAPSAGRGFGGPVGRDAGVNTGVPRGSTVRAACDS